MWPIGWGWAAVLEVLGPPVPGRKASLSLFGLPISPQALISGSAEGGGAPRAREDHRAERHARSPAASPGVRGPSRWRILGAGKGTRAGGERGRAGAACPCGKPARVRRAGAPSGPPGVPAPGGERARRAPTPAPSPPPRLLCVAVKRLSINLVWTVEREHKGCLLSG